MISTKLTFTHGAFRFDRSALAYRWAVDRPCVQAIAWDPQATENSLVRARTLGCPSEVAYRAAAFQASC